MKKLSFFLMAMLFSVMSFAAEATAEISFANKAQRTEFSDTKQVWEQNGIVVTNEKAASTNNVGDYYNPARFYKGSKVTIQCTLGNIKKIEISGCGANDKTTPWNTNGDAVVNGTSATITPTSTSDTYTIATLNGQARAGKMVITYEVADAGFVSTPAIEGEQYFKESATVSMKAAEGLKVYYTLDGTDPTNASPEYTAPFEVKETTTVKAIAHDGENASNVVTVVFKKMQVLTCAEAAAITPNGDKYIVRGYVTSASAYNTQYNNIDFFVADTKDGGEVLKVFRAVAASEADKAVKEGDYVEVIGELAAFYETIQIAQGGTYTIIPEPEPEIEWMEMDLEITNLTTEVMEVAGAKYLQLAGRDDINDADVRLFLNNYADVDDDYEVNAESSYMTFGGIELNVLEGVMTQTSETDKGTIYEGTVRTYAEEEDRYIEFALTMYAAPATVLVLTDAIVAINEETGTLTFNVPTEEGEGYYVELAGYTEPGVYEGPQVCLLETPEVVAYGTYAEVVVENNVYTLTCKGMASAMGSRFDLTISGTVQQGPSTGVENLNGAVVPVKMIENGQLIVIKDGVKFNAQGAVVK